MKSRDMGIRVGAKIVKWVSVINAIMSMYCINQIEACLCGF